jgi:hypothetical protein
MLVCIRSHPHLGLKLEGMANRDKSVKTRQQEQLMSVMSVTE